MATRYNKEKYALIRGMKNEPLSQFAANQKRRKLHDKKGDTVVSPSIESLYHEVYGLNSSLVDRIFIMNLII